MRFRSFVSSLMLLLVLLVALPRVARAQVPVQTPPIVTLRFVSTGGVSPVTNDVPVTSITGPAACTTVPPGTVHNPNSFEYKINQADAQCFKYTDPGNGALQAIPIGTSTWTSTLAYVTSTGLVGPASAVSNPFDHPGSAPTTAPTPPRVLP